MKNEAPAAAAPEFYIWSFPGCPIRVYLALAVVRDLNRLIQKSEAKAAKDGVLTGRMAGGKILITGFEIPEYCGEPDAIAELAQRRGEEAAGYFRLNRGGEMLQLSERDVALADCVFPKPNQVILLVQPAGAGPASAAFFFRDRGKINSNSPFLEFPFEASLLVAEWEQEQRKRNELGGAVPRRRRRWLLVAAPVCLLAAGGLAWLASSPGAPSDPRIEQPHDRGVKALPGGAPGASLDIPALLKRLRPELPAPAAQRPRQDLAASAARRGALIAPVRVRVVPRLPFKLDIAPRP
jgi:hypothetical protein